MFFEKRRNRINRETHFTDYISHLLKTKKINARQDHIIEKLRNSKTIKSLSILQQQVWYVELYRNLSDKTKKRDIVGLVGQFLLKHDKRSGEIILCNSERIQ